MNDNRIELLLEYARQKGATKASCIQPDKVTIESRLSAFCREPKCPHFGQSASCPPHISGPSMLRNLLKQSKHVIVVRIEVEGDSLHGEERPFVMQLLHEITAEIELEAQRIGFPNSLGLAAGSCKKSFCDEHLVCNVINGDGTCRHPTKARQSMSGYGVNVGELMKSAGWSTELFSNAGSDENEELAWVAGLIILL